MRRNEKKALIQNTDDGQKNREKNAETRIMSVAAVWMLNFFDCYIWYVGSCWVSYLSKQYVLLLLIISFSAVSVTVNLLDYNQYY